MSNVRVAQVLKEAADYLELRGENPFRVRAYRRAAETIAGLGEEVRHLIERGTLEEVPGVGKDLAAKIREIAETGTFREYDQVRGGLPPGLLRLLEIPTVGPKTVKLLYDALGIDSLQALEGAARAGRLHGLPGLGAKTEANVLKGIEELKRASDRTPLGRALSLAETIIGALRDIKGVRRVDYAGSLRRMKETVGDIDILAISQQPKLVMEAFLGLPQVSDVLARGETKASIRTSEGIQVDLRVLEERAYGAALAYFTGSKAHNIRLRELARKRGLKLSEYGLFTERTGKWVGGRTEEEIYHRLGLPGIPPELREDSGEIEAALAGRLPDLITVADIRGDLHVHTDWSDGDHPLEEIVETARHRGYEYVAITDHSPSLGVARGLTVDRLRRQGETIAAINRRLKGFRVLRGTEVDILADGRLDFPDRVLADLDFVVASVHSGLRQDPARMTARLLKALESPYVRALGHPTGRMLGEREGYAFDTNLIFRAAKERGVAVEVNASPFRLDLGDALCRAAKEAGLSFVIDTDMHTLSNFDHMALGVATARRGWVEKKDVLNALPLPALLKRLKKS
ncbi:MAG: DNA polymerase/3'-5' exonuclease PolX [Candidatus Methylomirabilales bacterium]